MSYPMFVPNFKILGAVVPEKFLTKKVYTQTDGHTENIITEKTNAGVIIWQGHF